VSARAFAGATAIAVGAVIIGMTGAAAFNPDDGLVAHVDLLWRVFGIGVYLGVIALPVILLTGLVTFVMRFAGRLRPRNPS